AGDSGVRLEDLSLEEVELHLIKKALARYGGSARDAAEALGMSRATLYRRLQEDGLLLGPGWVFSGENNRAMHDIYHPTRPRRTLPFEAHVQVLAPPCAC